MVFNNMIPTLLSNTSNIYLECLICMFHTLRNDFAAAWMNLGIVLSAQHKYIKAEFAYLTALQHRKSYPHCYFNLGNLVRKFV